MRACITSSSVTSTRYCESGLWTECLWFFTDTLAKCSAVVPCLRMCSTPACPNTAGISPLPNTPSTLSPPLRAPPPSRPIFPICSTPTAMVASYMPDATPT